MTTLDEALSVAVLAVTKRWARQRKAEERREDALWRRAEAFRPRPDTWVDAAEAYMEAAYLKASANDTLIAHARQIMYAIRPDAQEMVGKVLDSKYFTQHLLPDYLERHPTETAGWKVAWDARGHFHEPHTGKIVPLGGIAVEGYLAGGADEAPVPQLDRRYPTHGPTDRFKAVMFIEKEGFDELLAQAAIAARFDIAIMSTKGMSVTASRRLVEALDVPLLVLHDFDQAGFSIIGTLRRSTRRYRYRHDVEVIDLGIRLGDIDAYGLQTEQWTPSKRTSRATLLRNGATREDIAFLDRGLRVELNAFSSDDLVDLIEKRPAEAGVEKVIPDDDRLEVAYRRAYRLTLLNDAITVASEAAGREAADAPLPDELTDLVRRRLDADPALSWDEALAAIVDEAMRAAR